jgi:hypothetical protein
MIRIYTPQDSGAYQTFIDSFNKDYLFYAQRAYIDTVRKAISCVEETLIFEDNGEIKGVFPLLSKVGSLGKVYNSLPFYGSHGGAITRSPKIAQNLYNYVLAPSFGNGDKGLIMISENPFIPIESTINFPENLITEDRIIQVTPLDKLSNEDELMSIFHYKTRNMVRKSLKVDFKLVESEDLFEPMYKLHVQNMEAIGGTVKPQSFYDSIRENYKFGSEYKLIGAEYKGELAGVLLLFYHNGVVDYHTPTINIEFRNLQPNSFLIFQSMLDAVRNGYKSWNWGGTWKTQESLYRFKNRWGANDLNYRYFVEVVNKEIFTSNSSTLLKEYPSFFTVPFDMLTKN